MTRIDKTIQAALISGSLITLASLDAGAAEPFVNLNHTAVSVTTGSTEVLAANAARGLALLVNDSDTVIYCKLGVAAAVNQGVRLNASGGSWELSAHFGNLDPRAINCIHCGSGSKTLLATEG